MWLLKVFKIDGLTGGGAAAGVGGGSKDKIYLMNRPTCVIGRQEEGNGIHIKDNSVSRKHLQVDLKDSDTLTITDLKSKFKTTLIEENIESNIKTEPRSLNPDEPCLVSNGSVYKIGSSTCIKFIKTSTLTVSCTRLEKAEKDLLKQRLKKLGAKFTEKPTNNCSFMVSHRYFATVKILNALVYAHPIVSPQFFEFCDNLSRERENYGGEGGGASGNFI
jgi:pSer/pThr/pTyr-binding forkhead associated (FHA) protein